MIDWICCFWTCGESVHHGWKFVMEQSIHLMARYEKAKEESVPYHFQGHFPNDWRNFLLTLPLKISTMFQ
jgi:hypothetical protein